MSLHQIIFIETLNHSNSLGNLSHFHTSAVRVHNCSTSSIVQLYQTATSFNKTTTAAPGQAEGDTAQAYQEDNLNSCPQKLFLAFPSAHNCHLYPSPCLYASKETTIHLPSDPKRKKLPTRDLPGCEQFKFESRTSSF